MERFLFEKKKLKNHINKKVYEFMQKYNALIAGGTITSLFTRAEINDVDIYFKTRREMAGFVQEIMEYGAWVVSYTKKAVLFTYENKEYQAIIFDEFETAAELFETFDFTVCMGAFDVNKEEFILHDDFMQHNSQRLLKFNGGTAFPIISALRVKKYESRGYTISKPEYVKIILSCMKIDTSDKEKVKDQLGGLYGYSMDKLIKDDDFTVDSIIQAISEIEFDDGYFEMPEKIGTYEPEFIATDIIGEENLVLIENSNGEYFVELPSGTIISYDKKPNEGRKIVSAKSLHNGYKCYKFVCKEGDRLTSFYDPSFEYEIGEVVTPKNTPGYGKGNGRLYVGKLDSTDSFSYNRKQDGVLIEIEIESLDDVWECDINNTFEIKKGKVLRIVDESEYGDIEPKESILPY